MGGVNSARDRAIFRYSVISLVRSLTVGGVSLSSAVRNVSKMTHFDVAGRPRSVSERTLYRWLSDFKDGNFDRLFDKPKEKIPFSKALPRELADFLKTQKADDAAVSIPEMIRRAEKQPELLGGVQVSRTTVWRACHRLGLPTTRVSVLKHKDMRRFAYEHRMQMVLCDGKRFKVGAKRTKRVAMVFIDDASRHVLHGVCGPSESTELFLKGLFEVIKRHGLMVILFVDNGSGFISKDTIEICAKIGITLIHGTAAYPEGHGKIERFNRTFKADLLRHLDGNPEIDESCAHLDLRIQTYFREDYGRRLHEGIDGVPEKRFLQDSRPLNFPPSMESLKHHFILRETRRVSKDNCISIDGVFYEMPLGYAGTHQDIRRHTLEHRLTFLHHGKLTDLLPVDLSGNAKARRSKRVRDEDPERSDSPKEKSSASLTFENRHSPIINSDGGYQYKDE